MEKSLNISAAQSDHSRNFKDFQWVYPVISRRSGGVSIGINLNKDKFCNFKCIYCQVDRKKSVPKLKPDIKEIIKELTQILEYFTPAGICTLKMFEQVPSNKKILNDIALSGDGEPTIAVNFPEVCKALHDFQLQTTLPFKLVLITNSTRLLKTRVITGMQEIMSSSGEIWAKLDGGSTAWYKKVNRSNISLDTIEKGLIQTGCKFPLTIQTLWCTIHNLAPPMAEIDRYIQRLLHIKEEGADLSVIQLHTLARPPSQSYCGPVSKKFLLEIQNIIQKRTRLKVVVY